MWEESLIFISAVTVTVLFNAISRIFLKTLKTGEINFFGIKTTVNIKLITPSNVTA
jgi:hypothetical protein